MRKRIVSITLVIFILLIISPPIIYGYVYPNNGDDSAFHLNRIEQLGDEVSYMYYGSIIFGYPVNLVSNVSGMSIDTVFLWFNVIALIVAGLSVYLLMSYVFDWQVGLLSIGLMIFCIPATLGLYDTGAIYDFITVGIVLPLMLFSLAKYIATKKWQWLIGIFIFVGLGITVHSIGILRAVSGVLEPSPNILEFVAVLFGYIPSAVFFVAIILMLQERRHITFTCKSKMTLMMLVGLTAIFIPASFTNITMWGTRLAIDMAVVVGLLLCCILGILIQTKRQKVVLVILSMAVLVGSLPMIYAYTRFNSAIKPIDLQAIEYINGLPGDYYSCSTEVAHWIYDRLLDKDYKEGSLPYVERNIPMTSLTTPGTRYYKRLVETVYDDAVTIREFHGRKGVVIFVISN